MKPFLLLQSRPEDEASDNEYDGFLAATGLAPAQLKRVRVEAAPLPVLDFDEYSGIIVGGGPFDVTTSQQEKTETQKRVEADFARLLDRLVMMDYPFFGACYGVGTLGVHQGAMISRKYSETVGAVAITLTDEGKKDSLLHGLPESFEAIVGHKEACEALPDHAVLLASSAACPVQMFRIKNNLYATQFHPELDMRGLTIRVNIYKHAGYFPPEDAEAVLEGAKSADLSFAPLILRNFVKRYQRL